MQKLDYQNIKFNFANVFLHFKIAFIIIFDNETQFFKMHFIHIDHIHSS